eukprot:3262451-Rhodomonas_salina.4
MRLCMNPQNCNSRTFIVVCRKRLLPRSSGAKPCVCEKSREDEKTRRWRRRKGRRKMRRNSSGKS